MKYQIVLDDNYILYDLREDSFIVEEPSLNLTINKIGVLTFTIYPDHPYFDRLEKLKSKITVTKNRKKIFVGRIISDEQGLYNSKNITCESNLSYLNDSIIRPNSFSGSPTEFLEMILNTHNSQVSDFQKIKMGNVTVQDPNNYISRSWVDYINSWEMLKNRGLDLLGGYIVERYEQDGTYIDWLNDFDLVSAQEIEFGENLMDILVQNDATKTYSVIIPLGAEIENDGGNKSRLDIKSVNDGKDYIVNDIALQKFGWKVAPVSETTWDDVTIPLNLKNKAINYLNSKAIMISSTLEITALDLNATDNDIESFFINKYINVKSKIHNFEKQYLLNSIEIPLEHPENTKIKLGETLNTLTGVQLGDKKNIDDVIIRVGNIEKDYIKNQELTEIVNETITTSTIIQQTEQDIMLNVSEKIQQIRNDIEVAISSTTLEQTKKAFTMWFEETGLRGELNGIIEDLDDNLIKVNTITEYIRFEGAKITLGKSDSNTKLVIENDIIKFMTGENVSAYISENQLYITDSTILNKLQIDRWETKPDELGNLNTRWVGVING